MARRAAAKALRPSQPAPFAPRAVDVTVTPEGQAPAVTRQRLQMEMTRTPSGWKVSKLSPVRAPTSGAGN